MAVEGFEPLEGGVAIVFDVPEALTEHIMRTVSDAGFEVRRYSQPADEHSVGGSAPGFVRLAAERAMQHFTEAEQRAIVAAFDAAQASAGFECHRTGTDIWQAGNGDGRSGDREPRRPSPLARTGSAVAPSPS